MIRRLSPRRYIWDSLFFFFFFPTGGWRRGGIVGRVTVRACCCACKAALVSFMVDYACSRDSAPISFANAPLISDLTLGSNNSALAETVPRALEGADLGSHISSHAGADARPHARSHLSPHPNSKPRAHTRPLATADQRS